MHIVMAVILLLAAGTPWQAAAQGNPEAGASAAARAVAALPADLAGFRRVGAVVDYERRPGGTGFGASAHYVPVNGERVRADLYLYDRGRTGLPEGAGSQAVTEELRLAAAELDAVVRIGRYRSVTPEVMVSSNGPSGAAAVRCGTYRIIQESGEATGSSVCITVRNARFVKLRLTTWDTADPAVAGLFGIALMSALRGG